MLRTALVCLLALTFAVSANASTIDVRLEASPPASGVCYTVGEVVAINVFYDSTFDQDLNVRLMQFSNAGMAAEFAAGFSDFVFDFSELTGDFLYSSYPTWPQPASAYIQSVPNPGFIKVVPALGSVSAGSFDYTIPAESVGSVVVDVINPGGDNPDLVGRFKAEFDPVVDLTPINGGLTGGAVELCIPEPASLGLLSVGALVLLRRRR